MSLAHEFIQRLWPHAGGKRLDALEILAILGTLGRLGDERAREALELVAAKSDAQGRWKLEMTMNGKWVVDIETKGEPSRWVTLRALQVLRAAGLGASG